MTITPEEIARLRALEAKATPGPWQSVNQSYRMRVYEVFAGGTSVCHVTCCEDGMDEKDCELIATSRNALPGLLDEIERLQAEVASLRLTLGGRTFSASVPSPVGCPAPGQCAQVAEIARLRAEAAFLKRQDGVAAALASTWEQEAYKSYAKNDELRADLREAVALLRTSGCVIPGATSACLSTAGRVQDEFDSRRDALLAKHKEEA